MATTPKAVRHFVIKKMAAKAIPFVRRSGLRVDIFKRGHVRCSMPLKPNKNHIGTMYAGALFTLAEMPGGVLFLSSFDNKAFFPIVKELTMKFVKPATETISVDITMTEERIQELQTLAKEKGKAEFILEGELKNSAGEVVAVSRGVYQLRAR